LIKHSTERERLLKITSQQWVSAFAAMTTRLYWFVSSFESQPS
jgi:hypothetical protein